MKRTIKSVSLMIGVAAIAFIFAGQVFGAQSTKSMQRVPAGSNMNKPNVGNVAGKPDLRVRPAYRGEAR